MPLLIGVIEHIFKLHDKISSVLKIRKRYDRKIIMFSFLKQLELEKELEKLNDVNVSVLMSSCFYEYASSTDPKIDRHNIELALNEWCWFWIILDTEVLLLLTGCLFLIIQFSWFNFLCVFIFAILLLTLSWLIKKQCIIYTQAEIKDILRDKERKKVIKETIRDAL